MTLRNLTLAVALSALLSGCNPQENSGDTATGTTAPVADTSQVVATVNGTPITTAMLDLYEEQMQNRSTGGQMNRAAILDEVINLELASQKGAAEGLADDTRIQLQIDQQRRAVVATAAIQDYLQANPVSDAELRKLYDEQVPKGSEYKARHILVDEEEQAKQLITELDEGADFSELAEQHSTGPSGKNGGELGWFSPKQMVAPFTEAVATLEKGSYTKEPVKTQFGWHVIVLDDTRESTPPAFEQVKPQLQSFLQKQRVQQYIGSLRQGADIEIEQPQAVESEAPASSQDASTEDSGAE